MSSLTKRPSRSPQRREAVELRVLAAVEELLAAGNSYVELSVQDLADAAGIARSTFYVHFSDKSELLVRLAEATMADIFAAGERWMTGPREGGPGELRRVGRQIIADYRRHEPLLRAVGAATSYDPVVAAWWHGRIRAFIDVTVQRLEQDQRDGAVDRDVAARPTAAMVVWSIERTVSMTVAVTGPAGDDELADALSRGIWLIMYGTL